MHPYDDYLILWTWGPRRAARTCVQSDVFGLGIIKPEQFVILCFSVYLGGLGDGGPVTRDGGVRRLKLALHQSVRTRSET